MDEFFDSKKCKTLLKLGLLKFHYFSPIWVSHIITVDNLDMEYVKEHQSPNLPHICQTLLDSRGKIVAFDKIYVGVLKGIEVSQEDYYYIIETDERTVSPSCVGPLHILESEN